MRPLSEHDKVSRTPSTVEVWVHVLVWMGLLSMANVDWINGWTASTARNSGLAPYEVLAFALLFYGNAFWLFPRQLVHGMWWQYALAAVVFFGGVELSRAIVVATLSETGTAAELLGQESLLFGEPAWAWLAWLCSSSYALVKAYVASRHRSKQLELTKAQAEIVALRARVDPHFLFNNLNTLDALIAPGNQEAHAFLRHLAKLFQRRTAHANQDMVLLADELDHAHSYAELLKTRFGESLQFDLTLPNQQIDKYRIVPGALEVALENVVKHNCIEEDEPLRTTLDLQQNVLWVRNTLRPRGPLDTTERSGQGLSILNRTCRLVLGRGLQTEETATHFAVAIPVQALAA